MPPVLTLSSLPQPEAEAIIGAGLNAFNDAAVGYADRLPPHVSVRDSADGAIPRDPPGTSRVFLTKDFR